MSYNVIIIFFIIFFLIFRMTSTTDVVKPVEDIDDNSDNSGDDYVMNTVTEISKKSKRWQDWNNAISKPDEDEENIILGDGTSFMFTEPKKEKQKNLKSLPLFQTPSVGPFIKIM